MQGYEEVNDDNETTFNDRPLGGSIQESVRDSIVEPEYNKNATSTNYSGGRQSSGLIFWRIWIRFINNID